jgi:isopentenyl diphosphate isomerase/L-lactate dehydrogenase-like FMN-dependent dehydrogenase
MPPATNELKRPESRREFLRFLATSPLLAYPGIGFARDAKPITDPNDAINVFDFQDAAKATLPVAHYGYLATGTNDDGTVRANREGFDKFALRVRRLVDVSNIDTSIELMGTQWETPIVIAPTGSQKAFHPEGEVAVARAARAKGHLQILSTVTTSSVEEVTEARGAPIWYQLYPTTEWSITTHLLSRAEAAGCPVVALTVDLQGGSNRETAERARRNDERQCDVCHAEGGYYDRKSMFDGVDTSRITNQEPLTMTWDYAKKIQDTTTMKLYIKGIVTAEDAALCVDNGIDGIVVSNHGGRAEASNRSTIECLPEIVAAVRGRIPVIIDGGFRRGTDIFKALALGANAIAIGRPYLWGLGAFGQPGVETVLSILRAELEMVMRQAGTTSIRAITKDYVV